MASSNITSVSSTSSKTTTQVSFLKQSSRVLSDKVRPTWSPLFHPNSTVSASSASWRARSLSIRRASMKSELPFRMSHTYEDDTRQIAETRILQENHWRSQFTFANGLVIYLIFKDACKYHLHLSRHVCLFIIICLFFKNIIILVKSSDICFQIINKDMCKVFQLLSKQYSSRNYYILSLININIPIKSNWNHLLIQFLWKTHNLNARI